MLKKVTIATLLTLSTSAFAATYGQPTTTTNSTNIAVVANNLYKNSNTLLNMSSNVLQISKILLASQQNGVAVDSDYVNAMLRLSNDIGTMADRILATEKEIGYMADRILETQKIQNENVALTQKNILEAQKNFLAVLNHK